MAAIAVYLAAPLIATDFINSSPSYVDDIIRSFRLLAVTIPFLMLNICFVGLLESCQKFSLIGILKLPIIFCNYVAPLIVLCYFNSLLSVVSVLVVGRIVSCVAYFWFCLKIIRNFSDKLRVKLSYIKPLLRFGGWMTVSNLVNTIIVNIDRFIIAGMISASIVAYYTTPLDALVRIWTIPCAIMSVMFPAFSAEFFANRERAKILYFKCVQTIFLIIFPVCTVLFLFAEQGLSFWLGNEFAERSHLIAQIIIIGIFLQSVNIVNYNFVQSTGRSEIQAKIHMFEFPLYIAALWLLVVHFGLAGAAIAWLIRIITDFILFNFFSLKLLRI
ncbi:MAG: oligosaccharide flippase family protein [Candidatus Gastranaerophilales bacterium]|nr:oligosaccharide flippase family protein [Candidatus Gastranaerophilales bacterium]